MQHREPARHHQVRTVLLVRRPRRQLLNERQRLPVLPHRRQPHLPSPKQSRYQRLNTQVLIQLVPGSGVWDNVDAVESLPLPHEIVGQQEALGGVDFDYPMADGVAHLERPVLPNLHYSAVLSATRIKAEKFLSR